MRSRRRRAEESAAPNLTPMIDVTFQLLVFFILCTRIVTPQEGFEAELPDKQGISSDTGVPQESITIDCIWNEDQRSGAYAISLDGRGRQVVSGSVLAYEHAIPGTVDGATRVAAYTRTFDALVDNLGRIEEQHANASAFEISFSNDAAHGARSGTVPWAYVTLAIDAVTKRNMLRKEAGLEPMAVNFKFADSRLLYAPQGG